MLRKCVDTLSHLNFIIQEKFHYLRRILKAARSMSKNKTNSKLHVFYASKEMLSID